MNKQNLKTDYFGHLIGVFFSFFCWLLPFQTQAQQEAEDILTLSPEKCVALRQGQTCYMDIKLNWKTREKADYCLFTSILEAPLHCWEKADKGELSIELSGNENIWFYLKRQQETVTQAELKMAWVYKSKRSSVTWRVF